MACPVPLHSVVKSSGVVTCKELDNERESKSHRKQEGVREGEEEEEEERRKEKKREEGEEREDICRILREGYQQRHTGGAAS